MAIFELPGDRRKEKYITHLFSNNRVYKHGTPIYHRNDIHTTLSVPNDIFKKLFYYDRSSGIYRSYHRSGEDLSDFMTIYDVSTPRAKVIYP